MQAWGSTRPRGQGFLDSRYYHLTPLPFAAKVTFADGDEITVPARGSRGVSFDVAPPQGLSPIDVPIVSGFVQATSTTTGDRLSIPYVGPAYNYMAASSLGTGPLGPEDRANVWNNDRDVLALPQVYVNADKTDIGDYRVFSLQGRDVPVAYYSTVQWARWWRMDLVPASLAQSRNFTRTYYGYDPNVKFDNLTEPDVKVDAVVGGVPILGYMFQGSPEVPNVLVNAVWQPPQDMETIVPIPVTRGSYLILLRWLKFGRDEDWESWLSGVVDIPKAS